MVSWYWFDCVIWCYITIPFNFLSRICAFADIADNLVDRMFTVNLCSLLDTFFVVANFVVFHFGCSLSDTRCCPLLSTTSVTRLVHGRKFSRAPLCTFGLARHAWACRRLAYPWLQGVRCPIRQYRVRYVLLIRRHGLQRCWENEVWT